MQFFYCLEYLQETRHTCSSCSWLQKQSLKIFNIVSTKQGAFFRQFCVPTVTTTVHVDKSGVIFILFTSFQTKKKIKDLRLNNKDG